MPLHTPPRSRSPSDSDSDFGPHPIVAWLEGLLLPSPPLYSSKRKHALIMTGHQPDAKRRRTGDQNEAEDEEEDLDRTPRADRFNLQCGKKKKKSTKSTTSALTDTGDSVSVDSGRSVKQISDTLFAFEPIVGRDYDPKDLPVRLADIFKRVKLFSISRSVLPNRLKASNPPLLPDDPDNEYLAFDNDNSRDLLGPIPNQDTVDRILRRTKVSHNHCEAEWNCRIHTAILSAAFENLTFDGIIDFLNCSVAKIERRLLPQYGSQKTRNVDFAVVLQMDTQEANSVNALAAWDTDFSINQTLYSPLRRAPIAISLEIKPAAEQWRSAELQVGIWVGAYFKRLQELLAMHEKQEDTMEPLSALPLLVVQGSKWHFLIAERKRGEGKQTTIWGPIQFGDSCNELGVYQIIATLQYLGKWATTEYREWFDRKVLRLPVAGSAAAASIVDSVIDTEPRAGGGLETNSLVKDTE
ncbi:uncharacterized protein K452DRAFT_257167 [Aplosporella prunicola CBS 121167]|uniref:PD-(D/E)XK nuclease-like domain-containing protein n=1 Tax=Aplosporella prunicola CBS 121167 TaxID=1176127 RepID=A0A6A6B2T5_9PEZI|nr:uncharacterized protein K452DRAFT_257167 [Aplosporella prunicola CBS 121167]KAF2137693.1 hypothetical protein K452DRAFT_257167 [Aplosporella prunicola CBS 121167]